MILFPNAKINIGLNIVARRQDGYHEIETVMAPIGWRDILEIVPAEEGDQTTISVSGRCIDCPVEENLVMKAYRLMLQAREIPPVRIFLHKAIPDGAGLGGGSSDAAFMLKGLNSLFSLGLGQSELSLMAAKLGADCPFFIYNRPMLATGIGEKLQSVDLDLSGYSLLAVKPQLKVPTAEAYAMAKPRKSTVRLTDLISLAVESWQGRICNDFEKSVFPGYPEIARIKEELLEAGALYASMSGSGSAVYGIFSCD